MHYYRGSPSKPPYICIHLHCLIPRKNGSESHLLTPKTNTSGKSQFFNVPFFQEIWFSNGLEQTPPGHWKTSTSWPSPTLPKVSFFADDTPGVCTVCGWVWGCWGKVNHNNGGSAKGWKWNAQTKHRNGWSNQKTLEHSKSSLACPSMSSYSGTCSTINLFNHLVLRSQVSLFVGYPLQSPSTIKIWPRSWWSWTITNHWWEKGVQCAWTYHIITWYLYILVKCMANSSNMYSRFHGTCGF